MARSQMLKRVERYPAGRLPADLRGSEVPADALVRVTIEAAETAGDESDVRALLAAVESLSDEARANGLTPERLEEILREADAARR